MARPPEFLVAAGMRNEGAFLLEWVCWYRMLGFDILVATNDCTDHSPALLNALHDAGWLTHITHSPDPGTPPKTSAHIAIRNHRLTAETNWLLICDVDEFLVLHRGDGTIGGFISGLRRPVAGIGFHWRVFGSSGETNWQDRLVHRTFTNAAPLFHKANSSFKSIFRHPLAFKTFGAHGPFGFDGDWNEGRNIWIDSQGRKLGNYDAKRRGQMATAPNRVTHSEAQMNHYVIGTEDSFDLKRGIKSASAHVDRYTDAFFENYNRNEEADESALKFAARFDAIHSEAQAIPGVLRLHHLSCADYVVRLAEKAGRIPKQDPRYAHHMDLAAAL